MDKVKDILHIHKSDKSGSKSGHGTSGISSGGTGTHSTGAGGVGKSHLPGGVSAPGGTGTGANVPSGASHGGHTGGNVTGVGSGTDYASAKSAATQAARQKEDVAINTGTGTAAGRPVGSGGATTGTGSATGGHTGSTGSGGYSAGKTTGVGAGSDYASAEEAARAAAHQKRDVNINTATGSAAGRPTGQTGGHTSSHTTGERTTGERTHGDVIDRKYYTGTEERPQDQAVIEKFREHNPYEKEYETTVQHTGRERQIGSHVESLGTEERVIGQNNLVSAPHAQIDRTVPTGAVNERPGGEGWVDTKRGPICDSTTFTVPGDRTVDKERVTNLRDHREYEKEFEVATRLKGEHATNTHQQAELIDRDHVIKGEKSKNACEGHPNV